MATLCLDASLEMLQPLFCHHTHTHTHTHTVSREISAAAFTKDLARLSRLLWFFWQAMSFKTAHSLQSRGLRSGLPKGQFWVLMKDRKFLHSHSSVVLTLWAGAESCWKTHFWPLKRFMLRGFTTPCSMSSWYTQAPVSPFSCKNEEVSPLTGPPPPQQTMM